MAGRFGPPFLHGEDRVLPVLEFRLSCLFKSKFALSAFALAALLAHGPLPLFASQTALFLTPESSPSDWRNVADAVSREIASAGYKVERIAFDDICREKFLASRNSSILVIPDASRLPARAARPIEDFTKAGGRILALRTPMWQTPLVKRDGRWVAIDEYRRLAVSDLPSRVIFDFSPKSVSDWRRATNDASSPSVCETVPDGPTPGVRALHVKISNFTNWDNWGKRDIRGAFSQQETLTVFSARGGEGTTQLALEWAEEDGSRWIAVIALEQHWQRYILRPSDFKYWGGGIGRGGGSFNPEKAASFSVGLAMSHTRLAAGKHEFWVGPIGTAKEGAIPDDDLNYDGEQGLPKLDTLSPAYKFFECHGPVRLVPRTDQAILHTVEFKPSGPVFSAHPRSRGVGYLKGRDWRYIPIVIAESADRQWRGAPVSLVVHSGGPFKSGIWAGFGFQNAGDCGNPAVRNAIRQIAERMRSGVFLTEGGSDKFTYFKGQRAKLGTKVSNFGEENAKGLKVMITVTDPATSKILAVFKQSVKTLPPGFEEEVCNSWLPPSDHPTWKSRGAVVTVKLFEGGRMIDIIRHEMNVYDSNPKPEFVRIEKSHFTLKGKRWKPHGVNYLPSSGLACEDFGYFEFWMGAKPYDPEVIERDLSKIASLGLNSVSAFIYEQDTEAQNLLDFLLRARRHDLKVNLSLRPGTPLDEYQRGVVEKIIRYYRLWDNDTVFAYDLAWEPMFGDHTARRIWDSRWRSWVEERYGSVESAEFDWGFSAPREEGAFSNPANEQVDADGPWRKMLAAYRRFLDTIVYEKYSSARRHLRKIDPNHLVSFRMAEAGNPTFRSAGVIPYDFPYLAKAVDFLAPEAYGRVGDWERVKPGWFQRAYARWAAPDKPMIWAEMGSTVWDNARMETSETLLKVQEKDYRLFHEMMDKSGADGVFYWWYAGGFRHGENSDYGIVNSDGTDRPVTKQVRSFARLFRNARGFGRPAAMLEFDRDRHPSGMAGVYDELKDSFWRLIDSGKSPSLFTSGTGTTSANTPAAAVGNSVWTGNNQHKYLDAAFDSVEILENGEWKDIEPGGTIRLPEGGRAQLRVSFTNLGEASWLKGGSGAITGYVILKAESGQWSTHSDIPHPLDMEHPSDLITLVIPEKAASPAAEISLRFWSAGRGPFGQKFTFYVIR